MSSLSVNQKNKKKVVCHVPTANQLESIKPIEVTCFLDENKITIENEKPHADGTATMMTIVPPRKRPISAPMKKPVVVPVTDMIIGKPVRHLAILPSSKEPYNRQMLAGPTDLSETFTMYDGPATTPVVGQSLDETVTLEKENQTVVVRIPIQIEELNLCNNTTMSSACELVDQSKLPSKPHSLIGRYQIPPTDVPSKPVLPPPPPTPPSIHIATVHYVETPPVEAPNKQVLIQQFYEQLEKMKATFNTNPTDSSPQITTNTLTFDNGQVIQSSTTNQLKGKAATPTARHISNTTTSQNNKKPPIPKKPRTTKNPSIRIQSAPVTMATPANKTRNPSAVSSCQPARPIERIVTQPKKSQPKKDKPIRRIESAPSNHVEFRTSEATLLPHEEQECRQMFEKLQRLQPNGVCADLNTLRRALYPPVGTSTVSSNLNHLQTLASPFKSHRARTDEMPLSWVKVDDKYVSQYVAKQPVTSTPTMPQDNTDLERIADQMKKHAAINYSYYTRTK